MAENSRDDDAALGTLRDMVMDIRVAMITTEGTDGAMHSRPMYLQQVEEDGDLWFATSGGSPLAEQVRHDARVLATFAEPDDHKFAVIRGTAALVRDPAKVEELWNPGMKAWFPNGPTDPEITLVHVRAEHGDYWDAPGGPARIVKFAAALLTGTRPDGGERVHLDLDASKQ
ncbi:MAG: pyridoxamine 5'-phosphate oxidase family protein [Gemmatimonadota bacterium]